MVPLLPNNVTRSPSSLQPLYNRVLFYSNMDLVDPLPASEEGHVYLLTSIDHLGGRILRKKMEVSTRAEHFVAG
jgi:hypothetical protein